MVCSMPNVPKLRDARPKRELNTLNPLQAGDGTPHYWAR
ncbi:hypothetical protein HBZC1_11080 [Helicobacter bizzozeronii CIII-1]|uniref:Uncharacterized protein n=1 Tax=Helicobacter bizzozeronii (strain CIII-1) TaxID=1002804 RepID=F8KTE3_HELBC|nr:hypothetical protein HBZC1_11080 [Helicobacter bizzozeronii CIII-1]CCF80073.1 hypothetical protein HBZS_105210 [Helicobacter bizzozeronii CCUG 35545]